jgi:hypothetical protein
MAAGSIRNVARASCTGRAGGRVQNGKVESMRSKRAAFEWLSGLCLFGVVGCGGIAEDTDLEDADAEVGTSWEALIADGDTDAITRPTEPASAPLPAASAPECTSCPAQPLAFWKLDDCNPLSTELADSAYTGLTQHPAFRAVSVACDAGVSGQGVRLSAGEDVVYAPDQPDFDFTHGLTVAAFIEPDRLRGTQSIVRKRFDDSSSFVLAIHDRQLNFIVRLASGRLAGVSAPIEAGRFSHVAATHDGRRVRLYVDGALVAQTRASGQLARGVGPIFIGNDADGRQFKGSIDEIWLDDSAASADTVAELRCIRRAPELSLLPLESAPQTAGDTVHYDLSITNRNDASCPADEFTYFPSLPYELFSDSFGVATLAPGETAQAGIDVRSSKAASAGTYPVDVYVYAQNDAVNSGFAEASYVVGTGPISCDGVPPFTSNITGSIDTPVVGFALYTAPGLQPLVATPLTSSDGILQGLHILAQPGIPSESANDWFGVDMYLGNPSCVDASAYTGIQFTVTGELSTCRLALEAVTAEDNQIAFGGACSQEICFGPFSGPLGTGTSVVRFVDMTGGVPVASVDTTALQGIQWALNAPSDGVTDPCLADFTITDISFVSGP